MGQDLWKAGFAVLAADGVLRKLGSIESRDYRSCFHSIPDFIYANFYQVAMGNLCLWGLGAKVLGRGVNGRVLCPEPCYCK